MMDVRDACEEVWAREIGRLGLGCDVVAGSREEDRPDECVICEAGEAEHRAGGMYMVDMAVRILVPVGKPSARVDARTRLGLITRWLDRADCVLRQMRDAGTGIYIAGYSTTGQEEERGTRLVEITLGVRVGCGMED